ncbi:PRELI-like family-domain-containing protein [Scheffersomyces coipomensis]|uniref:PRELI-like family-domain-containing protein n=1 Tax=Scheffersomyces coipomensis TaxID=1788519 RepID=UPI00315DBD62
MVLFFESSHEFQHDFQTSTLAFFNRYPNPFAKHVLSSDTIEQYIDEDGCLRVTKVIVKSGRLPNFIKPFLGTSVNSWIIEKSITNPKTNTLMSYTANVDHRKFIKVEEYLTYYTADHNEDITLLDAKVKFSSNLFGFKQKIEQWSHRRFSSNLHNTREGLKYVMNRLQQTGGIWQVDETVTSLN